MRQYEYQRSRSFLRNHLADWSQISCGSSIRIWERKLVQMVQVTGPRWPPCPYMVKTWKILLWNQKADDLESRYATWGTWVLPRLFKWWLGWLMARLNFVPYAFGWEDGKTMDFSETIVVYDIKIDRFSQLNEYMKLMSTKGQVNSLTFVQISQVQYFETSFPPKPLGQLKLNMWSFLGMREMKACPNGQFHMTKMATIPIYGKNVTNLVWNRKADDLETWYEASSTIKFVQMMSLG